MWSHIARSLGLAGALFLLGGCCTTEECLNTRSGNDRNRVNCPRVNLDVVYNDSVSGTRRDRTDWRYVMLLRKGTLTVQLHWDNGKANLELDIFDVMGMKIQEGRVFGTGGLRALVAIEEPNPYYIRIRAAGPSDESQYAVRISFEHGKGACNDCKPSDRKCLDTNAVIICENVAPGCNAWNRILPCAPGVACRNGVCDPCASPCADGSRHCVSGTEFQICGTQPGAACPAFGATQKCPAKQHCRDGQCVKSGVAKPRCPATCPPGFVCNRSLGQCVRPAAVTQPTTSIKCHIISVYKYREEWTLHLECGDSGTVRPGQTGVVLEGMSDRPLPQGEVKVIRVSGRYAIANTRLQQLGLNRWVRINPPR